MGVPPQRVSGQGGVGSLRGTSMLGKITLTGAGTSTDWVNKYWYRKPIWMRGYGFTDKDVKKLLYILLVLPQFWEIQCSMNALYTAYF